jgi:hypothetical protein
LSPQNKQNRNPEGSVLAHAAHTSFIDVARALGARSASADGGGSDAHPASVT